jgi:hypothetical protein
MNEAFWQARTAMRNEALRHLRGTTGETGQASR